MPAKAGIHDFLSGSRSRAMSQSQSFPLIRVGLAAYEEIAGYLGPWTDAGHLEILS
jgi:hypothetical protein